MGDMYTGFRPWEVMQGGFSDLNGTIADEVQGNKPLPPELQAFMRSQLGGSPAAQPALNGFSAPPMVSPANGGMNVWNGYAPQPNVPPARPPSKLTEDDGSTAPTTPEGAALKAQLAGAARDQQVQDQARQGVLPGGRFMAESPDMVNAPVAQPAPQSQVPAYQYKVKDLAMLKSIWPLLEAKQNAEMRAMVAQIGANAGLQKEQVKGANALDRAKTRVEGAKTVEGMREGAAADRQQAALEAKAKLQEKQLAALAEDHAQNRAVELGKMASRLEAARIAAAAKMGSAKIAAEARKEVSDTEQKLISGFQSMIGRVGGFAQQNPVLYNILKDSAADINRKAGKQLIDPQSIDAAALNNSLTAPNLQNPYGPKTEE